MESNPLRVFIDTNVFLDYIQMRDIEDALQYFSAELSNADYIVTRNPKDFSFATTVQIIEPKDFINAYFPNEV